jgi:hypothetical protein
MRSLSPKAVRRRLLLLVLLICVAVAVAAWRIFSLRSRSAEQGVLLSSAASLRRDVRIDSRSSSAKAVSSAAGDALEMLVAEKMHGGDQLLNLAGNERGLLREKKRAGGPPVNDPLQVELPDGAASRTESIERHDKEWRSTRKLQWNRSLYLPVDNEVSLQAFWRYEAKQLRRAAKFPNVTDIKWGQRTDAESCLRETPECEFFLNISCPVTFRKCCAEHLRLKQTLFYVLDVAERHDLQLFLDSGTLLSAWRDGGDTLVPWETDIDLGVVGHVRGLVAEPFEQDGRRAVQRLSVGSAARRLGAEHIREQSAAHWFEACSTVDAAAAGRRRSKGNAGESDKYCSDAHYVYFQPNATMAKIDTCRVEIWPFRQMSGDSAFLAHPTRMHLTVPTEVVVPLSSHGGRCRVWGRECLCPQDPERYLSQWYPENDWRLPQTIHWQEHNAPAWKSLPSV